MRLVALALFALVLSGCIPFLPLRGSLHSPAEPVTDRSVDLPPGLYIAAEARLVSWLPPTVRPSRDAYVDGYAIYVRAYRFWPDGLFATTMMFPAEARWLKPPEPGTADWDLDVAAATATLEAYYTTGYGANPRRGVSPLQWGTYQIRSDTLELRRLTLSIEAHPRPGSVSTRRVHLTDASFTETWTEPARRGGLEPHQATYRFHPSAVMLDRDGNPADGYRFAMVD